MTSYAGAQSIQNWTERVEHQPLAVLTKHARIKEHGREEDSKREKHFHDEFDITQKQACCGDEHPDARSHQDEDRNQNGGPKKIWSDSDSLNGQENDQSSRRDEKVDQRIETDSNSTSCRLSRSRSAR